MIMGGEKIRKRSIGSLMHKKLSDITNSNSLEQRKLETFPTNHYSIQQLLKERVTLMQLLAEKDKMNELSGAQLQRVRANIKKSQLQNWNLVQSNSLMLAELNLGRESVHRRRMRRHSITCTRHEPEPSENLFEIEDANYLVTQSGPNMLSVKDEIGERFGFRNKAPRSFGRPMRRAVDKVQSYKKIPLNVKMRRLV